MADPKNNNVKLQSCCVLILSMLSIGLAIAFCICMFSKKKCNCDNFSNCNSNNKCFFAPSGDLAKKIYNDGLNENADLNKFKSPEYSNVNEWDMSMFKK